MKAAKITNGKLRCAVDKGMFSDEATITIKDIGGLKHTFFVPKDRVIDDTVLVQYKKGSDAVCVKIPTAEPNSIVYVRSEDVF